MRPHPPLPGSSAEFYRARARARARGWLDRPKASSQPAMSSPTQSASGEGSEVFEGIDAQKLAGALENAKTLGIMEQEGVPSHMLPLQQQQREQSTEPEKLPPPGKKARALFPFEGQREKELIIDLLHTVNENWLEGMVGQTKGIFPTSHVQVLSHEELREALARESAPLMQARATYDFDPQNERELQFKKGDIIAITKKIDDNWFQETRKESFPRHTLRYWKKSFPRDIGSNPVTMQYQV